MIDSKTEYRISPNETNVIKGIAICAMLWHHLFLGNKEYGEAVFSLALTCKVCVALFVFLSGYGMATQFNKIYPCESVRVKCIDVAKFLFKRYFKFYLNYWIVFFITVPLGCLCSDAR